MQVLRYTSLTTAVVAKDAKRNQATPYRELTLYTGPSVVWLVSVIEFNEQLLPYFIVSPCILQFNNG